MQNTRVDTRGAWPAAPVSLGATRPERPAMPASRGHFRLGVPGKRGPASGGGRHTEANRAAG